MSDRVVEWEGKYLRIVRDADEIVGGDLFVSNEWHRHAP